MPADGDPLDAIMRAWAAAKIQKLHILNYNGANLAFNHAADVANKLGLSDAQKAGVTPFPCPVNISMEQAQLEPKPPVAMPAPKSSWLDALIVTAGAALVGGGILAGSWLMRPETGKPVVPTTHSSRDGKVGLEVEGFK